ncbi:MAG: hypothetical protein CMQ08_14440 [Gammaproteobacteria bacterium]|uniref:Uncharacterized protein n=1 Tax=OM182 bacterium MED-G28 TaxID=1986256 RepID=A0A2A5W9I1_9GAMM|nr:hypothetical protein [Gammaproteobacteria bacterium]PDH32927.1 MAG: hypothetical protein CNF02_10640 [OM182 bacterium MED-G28]
MFLMNSFCFQEFDLVELANACALYHSFKVRQINAQSNPRQVKTRLDISFPQDYAALQFTER